MKNEEHGGMMPGHEECHKESAHYKMNIGGMEVDTGGPRASKKIEILMREGVPKDRAVATALSMERAGRLTKSGDYVPVKKGKGTHGKKT